jgi:hypothetical protein
MPEATVGMPLHESGSRMSATPGLIGVACALLGLHAWIGYGKFAMRGIEAVISHEPDLARRMASYADGFLFAQMLLGVLAILPGSIATAKGVDSRLARTSGVSAVCAEVVVLALSMMLV